MVDRNDLNVVDQQSKLNERRMVPVFIGCYYQISILGPGQVIGDIEILKESNTKFQAVCMSDKVEYLTISKHHYLELLVEWPEILKTVIKKCKTKEQFYNQKLKMNYQNRDNNMKVQIVDLINKSKYSINELDHYFEQKISIRDTLKFQQYF